MTIWCKFYFYVIEHPTECMAVFISMLALFTTILSNYRDRKHKRLSVRPYISLTSYVGFDGDIYFKLENNGLGPAYILSISFHYNGEEYDNIGEIIDKTLEDIDLSDHASLRDNIYMTASHDYMFAEKSKLNLYEGKIAQFQVEDLERFLKYMREWRLRIVYEDMYKKRTTKTF